MLAVRGMVDWAEGLVETASAGSLAAEVVDEITARVTSVGNGDGLARPDPPPGLTPAAEEQWAVLRADAFYSLVLDRLTDQFLLVTLVDDVPGTQRVLKFSYEELGEFASEPWPRGPLAALGWLPRRAASAAESLFSAESYHFEADLPPGIDVPVASHPRGPRPRSATRARHVAQRGACPSPGGDGAPQRRGPLAAVRPSLEQRRRPSRRPPARAPGRSPARRPHQRLTPPRSVAFWCPVDAEGNTRPT
jgi:hypothetical protein